MLCVNSPESMHAEGSTRLGHCYYSIVPNNILYGELAIKRDNHTLEILLLFASLFSQALYYTES